MGSVSLRQAILTEKCPHCRQGNLFAGRPYDIGKFYRMHRHCPACGQLLEPEPGFYFGAMFVAYGMLVLMSGFTWLLLFFLFHPPFAMYVIVILVLNILLLPFIFRYSRTLFLFGFGGIKYIETQ